MTKIFISYRRQDSQQMAERIYDILSPHFPVIFYDLNTIEYGRDFADKIQQGIYEADVVLVLIGHQWADIMRERFKQPEDFVRIEIETALEQRKRVIPILIDDAPMPPSDVLSWRIRDRFSRLNAQHLHVTNPYFRIDAEQLIHTLSNLETIPPPAPLPPMRSTDIRSWWRQSTFGAALFALLFAGVALWALSQIGGEIQVIEQTVEVPVTQIVEQTVEVSVIQIVEQTVEVPVTRIPTSPDNTLDSLKEETAIAGVTSNFEWRSLAGTSGYAKTFVSDFDQIEMVLVPSGEFEMGSSSPEADEDEIPHLQTIQAPFWISKYEVTTTQFAAFLNNNSNENMSSEGVDYIDASDADANIYYLNDKWLPKPDLENYPVIEVTWYGARDYCQWLGAGFRLPTEKEWEYAASGPNNWEYPWGHIWNRDYAIWDISSNGQLAEVGTLERGASWVGALDMSGNVWEWTSSIFRKYPYVDSNNELGATGSRVLRGGSWDTSNVTFIRTANRLGVSPEDASDVRGFRCMRSYFQ